MISEEERKRIEAKGFRVTTVKEFLGLTDAEAEYIELKVRLSMKLREKRRQRKMGQVQLAKLIKSSQSRVAKMEAGDQSVSLDLVINALYALGLKNADLGRIISQARPPA